MPRKSLITRIGAAVLTMFALTFAVSACSSDDSDTNSVSTDPVAMIDPVTGVDTQVTLDAGFVDALTALKVTPAPVGKATISQDGVAALPDHRRQRHLLRPEVGRPSVRHRHPRCTKAAGSA